MKATQKLIGVERCPRLSTAFQDDRENTYKITRCLERWADTGCWWQGESAKIFYRIICRDGSIHEIFQEEQSQEWYLYRTYD